MGWRGSLENGVRSRHLWTLEKPRIIQNDMQDYVCVVFSWCETRPSPTAAGTLRQDQFIRNKGKRKFPMRASLDEQQV